jgi:CheY-like chemotaxis protein
MENEKKNETTTTPLMGKRVFIVEDDVLLGDLIVSHMEKEHISLERFMTGEAVLEGLKKEIPDIILLDIFLPGMNGLTALEMIRKDPRTRDVPVVVISNTDQKKDREKAAGLNADFMLKAITTPAEIVSFVEKKLGAKS